MTANARQADLLRFICDRGEVPRNLLDGRALRPLLSQGWATDHAGRAGALRHPGLQFSMHLSPRSCTHPPDAADLEPQSHIVYHDRAAGANPEPGLPKDAEAVASATRITRHGGLIIELGRRASDPEQALHITAILTVAQAVGMLFEQAQDEVGGISPPSALFACPTPDGRGVAGVDAVAAWVRDKHEEARRLGVPRLASLLVRAGIRGDVELAADQLWSGYGY